jgi:hypothetical protein
MRFTYIIESNLLYSKSTYFNENLIHNILMELSRIMFGQRAGHCGPVKLTHKKSYDKQGGTKLVAPQGISWARTLEEGRLVHSPSFTSFTWFPRKLRPRVDKGLRVFTGKDNSDGKMV